MGSPSTQNVTTCSEGPLIARHVATLKQSGRLVASNQLGIVYCVSANKLISFDTSGQTKWEMEVNDTINGIVCIKDMLVISNAGVIELRDDLTGNKLDKLPVSKCQGILSFGVMCPSSENTLLVCNWSMSAPTILLELSVEGRKLTQLDKIRKIQSNGIDGLVTVSEGDKKLIVLTTAFKQVIMAMDYNTGDQVWKIDRQIFEGKSLRPRTMCTDNLGHIFVADRDSNKSKRTKNRVLMLNTAGDIISSIISMNTEPYDLAWVEHKIVVADFDGKIQIYSLITGQDEGSVTLSTDSLSISESYF